MSTIIAYKLVRKMKDGSLSSLFINKKDRLEKYKWLKAESHPTKGYSYRVGWHCCLKPIAPHLSEKDRVWVKVLITDVKFFERPKNQGGIWALAKNMKIIEELNK